MTDTEQRIENLERLVEALTNRVAELESKLEHNAPAIQAAWRSVPFGPLPESSPPPTNVNLSEERKRRLLQINNEMRKLGGQDDD